MGLGSALSEVNTTKGDFGDFVGNFSKGQQMAFREDQIKAQEAAKKQARLDEIRSKITYSGDVMLDKHRKEADNIYINTVDEAQRLSKAGDNNGVYRTINEGRMKLAVVKAHNKSDLNIIKDKDYGQIAVNAKDKSQAIVDYENKYVPKDLQRAQFDEDEAALVLAPAPDKKRIDYKAMFNQASSGGHMKDIKGTNGVYTTELDVSHPGYQRAKEGIIETVVNDKSQRYDIVHSEQYRKAIDEKEEKLKKDWKKLPLGIKNSTSPELTDDDRNDVIKEIVTKNYDKNEVPFIKTRAIPQGGSSNNTANYFIGGKNHDKWDYTNGENGYTKVEIRGNPSAKPSFTGTILTPNGKVLKETRGIEVVKPEVKLFDHVRRIYEVIGADQEGNPINVRITEKEFDSVFKLTDAGKKANIQSWVPASKTMHWVKNEKGGVKNLNIKASTSTLSKFGVDTNAVKSNKPK
jgi:hypothetical protein